MILGQRKFDLEQRTAKFARSVHDYCLVLPKMIVNYEISRQLIRSASSIGANYVEANEAFSRRDYLMRVKICRKEAKESQYWLNLTRPSAINCQEKMKLIAESKELTNIFGAIVRKVESEV